MSHYFTNDNDNDLKGKTFNIRIKNNNYTFQTSSGVFSKDYLDFGSKILIESVIIEENDAEILDLGCGYGPVGIVFAKENPIKNIMMIDINNKAVELAKINAKLNSVSNVKIINNDLLNNINKTFDVIITNPPIRAGKKTVFDLYEQSYNSLNNKGKLYVVIQKKQGAPSTFDKLTEMFGKVEVVRKVKGYWIIKANK
ncbi:MAG TPA: class I SAM-dependent methyltransferase [Acholeplasma sp.]|nr:class I SAM-dependent methyltransferase [Acholeplasma sp.]